MDRFVQLLRERDYMNSPAAVPTQRLNGPQGVSPMTIENKNIEGFRQRGIHLSH